MVTLRDARTIRGTPLKVSIAPLSSGYDWVSTNKTQRGRAYNATTTHFLSVSRDPATNAAVYVLDSQTGAAITNCIYRKRER